MLLICNCYVKPLSSKEEQILYLRKDLYQHIVKNSKDNLIVKIGANERKLKIQPLYDDEFDIILEWHDDVLMDLKEYFLFLYDEINQKIHIGPIITMIMNIPEGTDLKLNAYLPFSYEMATFCRKHGGLFSIMPVASFLKGETSAFVYNEEKNNWVLQPIPAPNFIYNRIHSRKIEGSQHFKNACLSWKEQGSSIYNESFLSKYDIYQVLKEHPSLKNHLPDTSFGLQLLEEMLQEHNDLFIKYDHGSQGRRLIRVFIQEDQTFHLQQNSFSKKPQYTYQNYKELEKQIHAWCKTRDYIVQETIPLVDFDGKKLDFRFLCHLSKEDWSISSIVARVAANNQFVSNVDQGGEMKKPLSVLSHLFSEHEAKQIMNDMRKLAALTCSEISTSYSGGFAELGIDIGVDINGKPWIIEVNSKPSKQNYLSKTAIRPSVKALIRFFYQNWVERGKE